MMPPVAAERTIASLIVSGSTVSRISFYMEPKYFKKYFKSNYF